MPYDIIYDQKGKVISMVKCEKSDPILALKQSELQRGWKCLRTNRQTEKLVSFATNRIDFIVDDNDNQQLVASRDIQERGIIRSVSIPSNVGTIEYVRTHKSIGDLVSITSAIQAARKQRPNAFIVVRVPLPARSILEHHPAINILTDIDTPIDNLPQPLVRVNFSSPCPCGEYESKLKYKTDKSRNEIFTLASGLQWRNEKPQLHLSKEECIYGRDLVNSSLVKADYHVHVAEEDDEFNAVEWVDDAINKDLDIVGANTHCNYDKSLLYSQMLQETADGIGCDIKFVPVVEIKITDSKRDFHLLCIEPTEPVSDCKISEVEKLKVKCCKLVLAHPRYPFNDFIDLLDGVEVENGRHKCKFTDNVPIHKKYKGSDAHSIAEWSLKNIFTKVRVLNNKTKPNIGIALRTAEYWKDWPHTLEFIEQIKEWANVFVIDKNKSVNIDGVNNDLVGKALRSILSALIYLDIVITPDTSILHLCDALGVKCLGLFGSMPSKLHINKYDSYMSFIQGKCKLDQDSCMYDVCQGKGKYQPCMDNIKVEDVISKTKELLYGYKQKGKM